MSLGCSSFLAGLAKICEREPHEQFAEKYTCEETIGEGGFGSVHTCRSTATGELLAVKQIWKENNRVSREFQEEVRLWRKIGVHESIVALHSVFQDRQFCHAVMERCEMDLATLMEHSASQLSVSELAQHFRGALLAIEHVHAKGIVHRDIKPANFLLSLGLRLIKLCDFGCAAQLPKRGGLTEQCGTKGYKAPEIFTTPVSYGLAVDLWSFGVTAYELVFGCKPYEKPFLRNEMMAAQISYTPKDFSGAFPHPGPDVCKFIRQLLTFHPQNRPSASQALESAFVKLKLPGSDSMQKEDAMAATDAKEDAMPATEDEQTPQAQTRLLDSDQEEEQQSAGQGGSLNSFMMVTDRRPSKDKDDFWWSAPQRSREISVCAQQFDIHDQSHD